MVQRVQRVVDCPAGNAYKISVTGLAFVSPALHDEEHPLPQAEVSNTSEPG